MIGDIRDPRYLMRTPYIWSSHYPWHSGESRLPDNSLTVEEKQVIEEKLRSFSSDIPEAKLIDFFQITRIVEVLHTQAQEEDVPRELRQSFSQSVVENVIHRLIASGMVAQIKVSQNLDYYLLARASYTSLEDKERSYILVGDTAQYFRLLKDWQQRQAGTMRILEEFSIPRETIDQALKEIDDWIRVWADKHHRDDGVPMILQMVVGQYNEENKLL